MAKLSKILGEGGRGRPAMQGEYHGTQVAIKTFHIHSTKKVKEGKKVRVQLA